MCGICGFIGMRADFNRHENAEATIKKMTDTLAHRGPDGWGCWVDMEHDVALGHRRLSILDLSDNGKQPMISQSGRYVISFNGEIYNFPELKSNLEAKGIRFRSSCDTEVLLEYVDHYGFDEAMKQSTGMFGLAVYDRKKNRLHLARDRFGEKSVYYGWNQGRFLFGSELKALKAFPFFRPEIDTSSVYQFLKYNYVKAPWSIYKGIKKLLPGQIVTLELESRTLQERTYYDLEDVVRRGESQLTDASLDECADELDRILTRVITRQLKADVPVGLFLSSGIDSALTSAIAQKVCNGKLKTYSIGSYDEKLNEAVLAKEYARLLGTEHHEFYLDDRECIDIIHKIPQIYEEPFSHQSAIPTWLVSRLARKDVTVSISGDGGDELFAGYIRDVQLPVRYKFQTHVEQKYDSRFIDLYDYLQFFMFKVAGFHDDVLAHKAPKDRHYRTFGSEKIVDDLNRALHFEAVTFMESETLVKVDRASMANSLEVREPFLDPETAQFAFRLPEKYKYDRGSTKVILKKLLSRYLPERLFNIPKRGFHIPINRYLTSQPFEEVREWAFDEKNLMKSGLLNVPYAKKVIERQLAGAETLSLQNITYNILILQLWLKENNFI